MNRREFLVSGSVAVPVAVANKSGLGKWSRPSPLSQRELELLGISSYILKQFAEVNLEFYGLTGKALTEPLTHQAIVRVDDRDYVVKSTLMTIDSYHKSMNPENR